MPRIEADDVLSDIEFELLQGSISRDDLGQGIQTVRQFHNEMRTEILDAGKDDDLLDIARRQFQVNEMLITLLAETSAKVRTLQGDLRRATFFAQHAERSARPTSSAQIVAAADTSGQISMPPAGELDIDTSAWTERLGGGGGARLDELEATMDPDYLKLKMDVRPSHVPLLGRFLTRLRVALHSLTLFYAGKLAATQSDANRVYAEWILHEADIQRRQRMEIEALRAQIGELKRQIQPGE